MSSTGWVPGAVAVPVFSEDERFAIAGFLAGYSGLTREAYQLDLRQFTAWCASQGQSLFGVRRAHIEAFAREHQLGQQEPRAPRAVEDRRAIVLVTFVEPAARRERDQRLVHRVP